MTIDAIRQKTPEEFRAAVDGFDRRYVADWDAWLAVEPGVKARLFGQILRKWKATRPKAMRRVRSEARHGAPFLEDLLELAAEPLERLGDLTVLTLAHRRRCRARHLRSVGSVLESSLRRNRVLRRNHQSGSPPDRGTDRSRTDSNVREQIGAGRPETCAAWGGILEWVAEDIAAFESRNGPLANAVSPQFAHLACGRLYDMALGPRPRSNKGASPVWNGPLRGHCLPTSLPSWARMLRGDPRRSEGEVSGRPQLVRRMRPRFLRSSTQRASGPDPWLTGSSADLHRWGQQPGYPSSGEVLSLPRLPRTNQGQQPRQTATPALGCV